MGPFRTDDLVHAETVSQGRIRRPFRVGLRNSGVALAAIGVAGAAYVLRFADSRGDTAWWAWGAAGAGVVGVCFGHAYLGSLIGGRRANDIGLLFLFGCLAALIVWLSRATSSGQ